MSLDWLPVTDVPLNSGDHVYLLGRFQFTEDAAAPLTTPYTEPRAIGALTLVQTDGQFSKAGGKLVFVPQTTPAWADQGFYSGEFSRTLGLTLFGKVKFSVTNNSIFVFGFTPNANASIAVNSSFNFTTGGRIQFYEGGGASPIIGDWSLNVEYDAVLIMRAAGAFLLIKGGAFTNYTALHINALNAGALLRAVATNYNATGTLDDLRALQLPVSIVPRPLLSDSFNSAIVRDHGDLGLHGDPVYVKLDGTKGTYKTSYTNIYSADFNRVFDGQELTIIAYANRNGWSAASSQNILRLLVDGSNYIDIFTPGTSYLQVKYRAGAVDKGTTKGGFSGTNYISIGLTASKTGDVVRSFFNGVQEGADSTGLGTWAGSLDYRFCNLGAAYGAVQNWDGGIKDFILSVKAPGQAHAVVATPTQVAEIHTHLAAGTLTKSYLDSVFGASGYIWLRHNDTYLSDGRGHVEGQTVQAIDRGGNALHGTHNNVYLPGGYGQYAPGVHPLSHTNIYSAALNTKFNGQANFVVARCKVKNMGVWTDGSSRVAVRIRVDASNYIQLYKHSSNGRFDVDYAAGGVPKTVSKTSLISADYLIVGVSASKSADQMIVYFNGAQEGSTQTSLGTWAGSLHSSNSCIGNANTSSSSDGWSGDISDVIIGLNGVVATPTQMADLNTYLAAGTLNTSILDTMFGANNWAWYSFDEVGLYDGANLLWGGEGSWAKDASGNAIAIPVGGANLFDAGAGTFESGTYGWVAQGANTIANVGGALQITYVDNAVGAVMFLRAAGDLSTDLTVGKWYRYTTQMKVLAGNSVNIWLNDGLSAYYFAVTDTALTNKQIIFRSVHASNGYVRTTDMGAGDVATLDNQSLVELPFAELIRTVDVAEDDVIVMAKLTVDALYQAGVTVSADSQSNPLNFLYAYIDRTLAKLYFCKVLNGVPQTPLIDAAITYSAGAQIEVHKRGQEYRVIYNNALVGTVQTISDAAIISNTRHGAFSTGTGGKVESLVIWDNGYSSNRYAALAGF